MSKNLWCEICGPDINCRYPGMSFHEPRDDGLTWLQAQSIQPQQPKLSKKQEHGNQIAYRIRAELVCCRIYERVNVDRELTFKQALESPGWHDLCYWAEAAALIAETPRQWKGDPKENWQ